MNNKKLAVYLAITVSLLALTGCAHGHGAQLANEITFSLDGISEITISYDEENITFYESETDELTIREYMTENKKPYYGKVEQTSGSIHVSEGGKPLFQSGFSRYIEVYLPSSYQENLTVTTTDGGIDLSEPELSLTGLRIDSTAGAVKLGAVQAQTVRLSSTSGTLDVDYLRGDTISIDTTRGSLVCEQLEGAVTYTTTSGSADIGSAIGSGSYTASNSGQLHVVYTQVTGDLSFFNKNDDITLSLPADLEFDFMAETKNGLISTTFQNRASVSDSTTSCTVGEHPTVTIKAETKNGTIEVTQ